MPDATHRQKILCAGDSWFVKEWRMVAGEVWGVGDVVGNGEVLGGEVESPSIIWVCSKLQILKTLRDLSAVHPGISFIFLA